MGIIWTIIIGFVAGVIAKFIMPGDNEPSGFILTTILGIVGAFVATFLGQSLGWYRPGEGAGLLLGGREWLRFTDFPPGRIGRDVVRSDEVGQNADHHAEAGEAETANVASGVMVSDHALPPFAERRSSPRVRHASRRQAAAHRVRQRPLRRGDGIAPRLTLRLAAAAVLTAWGNDANRGSDTIRTLHHRMVSHRTARPLAPSSLKAAAAGD